jgi:hypothetical protein
MNHLLVYLYDVSTVVPLGEREEGRKEGRRGGGRRDVGKGEREGGRQGEWGEEGVREEGSGGERERKRDVSMYK